MKPLRPLGCSALVSCYVSTRRMECALLQPMPTTGVFAADWRRAWLIRGVEHPGGFGVGFAPLSLFSARESQRMFTELVVRSL